MIDEKENYINKIQDIADDWVKSMSSDKKPEYYEKCSDFCIVLKEIYLNKLSRKENNIVVSACEKVVNYFLDFDNKEQTIRCLNFINSCYNAVYPQNDAIDKWDFGFKNRENKFTLFSRVCKRAENSLVDKEKCTIATFDWWELIENVVKYTITINYRERTSSLYDVESIESVCLYLGERISKVYGKDFIGKVIQHVSRRSYAKRISKPDIIKKIDKELAKCVFFYMVSSIKEGHLASINEWFDQLENFSCKAGEEMAYTTIKIYIYCYYLAFYVCAPDKNVETISASNLVKKFVTNSDVKSEMETFFELIANKDKNITNDWEDGTYDIISSGIEKKVINDFSNDALNGLLQDPEQTLFEHAINDFVFCLICYIQFYLNNDSKIFKKHYPSIKITYIKQNYLERDCHNLLRRFFELMNVSDEDYNLNGCLDAAIYAIRSYCIEKEGN